MIARLALLSLMAAPAFAQDADIGRAHFYTHCATCHGLEGKGDGPMAGVLTIPPTNLTELTIQNGGVFPLARVVQRIDGRDPLVAHGSPMPVFGDFFERSFDVPMKTQAGQPILTSQPVVDLVAYLLELQRIEQD
ncbi:MULTISPECIES: c-type cytochrome [Mameliella]|uniref:Cytochrome c family protein n=1 Tax=Mameliella alba TaxID=561184 RepID=A0A0B3RT19_9RHOB|nr:MULTISPECIES: cytochrome c [Mameliella]MBV6635737.1 cytochrome c [Mameliella sp.]MCR9272795.1 cytochrome c [Paracoccaceae bacterium]ODM50026.1 cytochrome C [Ruegeria sp. PBVC088]KHQ51167.1 Cytochrome c family protein [Mameliella alba]MBY6121741.1 cytochrome c [Mameliella alba]